MCRWARPAEEVGQDSLRGTRHGRSRTPVGIEKDQGLFQTPLGTNCKQLDQSQDPSNGMHQRCLVQARVRGSGMGRLISYN